MSTGTLWTDMNCRLRRSATSIAEARAVPSGPGVYAWYRGGEAVYVGRAIGQDGLRGRVWKDHLRTGNDLSRSSFRRNVCEHLSIAPTSRTTIRPTVMTTTEIAPVNAWIQGCDVAWIECRTDEEATNLESRMKAEWKPPLTKR